MLQMREVAGRLFDEPRVRQHLARLLHEHAFEVYAGYAALDGKQRDGTGRIQKIIERDVLPLDEARETEAVDEAAMVEDLQLLVGFPVVAADEVQKQAGG